MKLIKAIFTAYNCHKDGIRRDGSRYHWHVFRVAYNVWKMGGNITQIISALLHDIMEKEKMTRDEMIEKFDLDVYMMVSSLSKVRGEHFISYTHRVYNHEGSSLIKLCDIKDNIDNHTSEKSKKEYADFLVNFYQKAK